MMIEEAPKKKKLDKLWIGLVLGLTVNVAMTILFFRTNGWNLIEDFYPVMMMLISNPGMMKPYALVLVLPNSGFGFLTYRLELWDAHKGVMGVTLLTFAILIIFMFN